MTIVLTTFGSNYNLRRYFTFNYGKVPNENILKIMGKQIPHPKYPWYKRYRIKFLRGIFEV